MNLVAPLLLLLAAAQDPETERLKKEVEKLKADQQVFVDQLEASLEQIRELTQALEKNKKDKATDKEFADRLNNDLQRLEEKHVDMARARKALEEQTKALLRSGAAGTPLLFGKVTAVANEIGLVVISVGADHGVREGEVFTIYRGGDLVARMAVDRTDRKWSAGKLTLRKLDPRVGDEASNGVDICPPAQAEQTTRAKADEFYRLAEEFLRKGDRSGAMTESQRAVETDPNHRAARALLAQLTGKLPATKPAEDVQALRKELDEVRSQVRQLSDRLLPSWQGFGIVVEPASEELREQLRIKDGLVIRRVRPASTAEHQGLQAYDVIPDLEEKQALEILESDRLLEIIRRGQRMNIPGVKRR
jgi:predicted secreted Zn-dependent protease